MSGCRSSRRRSRTRKRPDGLGGTLNLVDFAGVHAGDPDLRAVLQAAIFANSAYDSECLVEQHAAAADQEQPDGEEQDAADDEGADVDEPIASHEP